MLGIASFRRVAGTASHSSSPLPVAGIRSAIAIGAGESNIEDSHTCAVLPTGRCGAGARTTPDSSATAPDVTPPSRCGSRECAQPPRSAPASAHTCAVLAGGTVRCWGKNDPASWATAPIGVHHPGERQRHQHGHRGHRRACHTCAVLSGGTRLLGVELLRAVGKRHPPHVIDARAGKGIRKPPPSARAAATHANCWPTAPSNGGVRRLRGVGQRYPSRASTPVLVKGIRTAAAIAAGYGYTCVVLSGGTVKCWGDNVDGELGDGTNATHPRRRV